MLGFLIFRRKFYKHFRDKHAKRRINLLARGN
jgi:hypothetical protein